MKRLLFSWRAPCRAPSGFSLAELSVVLGLLAISASWAVPNLTHWWWRWRVEAIAQAWASDLQAAKLQAMRKGQGAHIQRLSDCLSTPLSDGDWRCGWQLVLPTESTSPLLLHRLDGQVMVQLFPKQNFLPFNSEGETVAGGLRLTIQAKPMKDMVRSVCINNAGRLRVVSAEVCA